MSLVHQRHFRRRATRFAILQRDEWQCAYCWRGLTIETATVDHLVPSSRGGKTSPRNLIAACGECNNRRRNRTVRAFLAAESERRGVANVARAVDALVGAITDRVARRLPIRDGVQLARFERAVRRLA